MDRRDLADLLASLGSACSVIALLERLPPTAERLYHLEELAGMVRCCQRELDRREALIGRVLEACR